MLEIKEQKYEINENAKPFHFKSNKSDKLVILVHGFTDSAGNLKTAAEKLYKGGISCYAVCLPGHGTHYKDLTNYTPWDCISHLEKEFLRLSKNYKDIYLVGMSFGGNLCLDLSIKYPKKIKGVACVGSPIKIRGHDLAKLFAPLILMIFKYRTRKYPSPYIKKKFLENGSYEFFPLRSVLELMNYLDEIRGKLDKVVVPAIIIKPVNKNNTKLSSADYIYKNIGSKSKKIIKIYDYYHSKSQDRIFNKALEFFNLKQNVKTNVK